MTTGARRALKPTCFLLLSLPAVLLASRAVAGGLGANPIERVTRDTGEAALQCLLFTLSLTPLRRWSGINELISLRRMAGLFAFFYAVAHLLTYVVLDQFFDWNAITGDLTKRPFIMAGAASLALMVPLAVTSTAGWIRRLGGRVWQRLHRLVYASAAFGVLHFWWLVKADATSPRRYGILLAFLLAARVWWSWRKRRASTGAPAPARA